MNLLVPSRRMSSGRAAIRSLLADAEQLNAAVAFVTVAGVRELRELLAGAGMLADFRIVVRGGPVSDPDAVVALADLGAEVRVVMGVEAPRFHPKLWISRGASWTRVLSGSGNLTAGGLDQNHEQFELLSLRLPECQIEADAHVERWSAFFNLGSPLAEAIVSPAWGEWIGQQERRRQLARQLAKLDRKLADSPPPLPAGEGLNWLAGVLQDAVPARYMVEMSRPSWGERVQIDAGDDRGFRYMFLSYGHASEVTLAIYPGDTLKQARHFYPRMDAGMQGRIVQLGAAPGWSVRPNFHFGFRDRGVIYDDGNPDRLPGYLEYWRANIHAHRQLPAAAWLPILKALAREQVVSSSYPRQFSEEIGRRSRLHPRPGLAITRAWPLREAERLARHGKLAAALVSAINRTLRLLGEPPLEA